MVGAPLLTTSVTLPPGSSALPAVGRVLTMTPLGAAVWGWTRSQSPIRPKVATSLQLLIAVAMVLLLFFAGRLAHLTLLMPLLSAAMIAVIGILAFWVTARPHTPSPPAKTDARPPAAELGALGAAADEAAGWVEKNPLGAIIAAIVFWMLAVRDPGELHLNLALSFLASVQGVILQIAANRGDRISSEVAMGTHANSTELLEMNKRQLEILARLDGLTDQVAALTGAVRTSPAAKERS